MEENNCEVGRSCGDYYGDVDYVVVGDDMSTDELQGQTENNTCNRHNRENTNLTARYRQATKDKDAFTLSNVEQFEYYTDAQRFLFSGCGSRWKRNSI